MSFPQIFMKYFMNRMKSQTQTEAKTQIQEATKEPSKFLFDLSLQNGAIELPRSAFNMEGLIIDLTKTVVFYEPFEGHNQLDAYWNMGIHYSYCHSHRTKQILAPASMKIVFPLFCIHFPSLTNKIECNYEKGCR